MSVSDIRDKLAIALQYERGEDEAPRVTASAKGHMAQQIITLAQEAGVEVREDADLAQILQSIEVGDMIPMEAFAAVAEILSYLYGRNQQAKGKPA